MDGKIRQKHCCNGWIILFIFMFLIFGMNLVKSEGVEGVIGIDLIPEESSSANYSTINVNNSDFWDGYDTYTEFDTLLNSTSFKRNAPYVSYVNIQDQLCLGIDECDDPFVDLQLNGPYFSTMLLTVSDHGWLDGLAFVFGDYYGDGEERGYISRLVGGNISIDSDGIELMKFAKDKSYFFTDLNINNTLEVTEGKIYSLDWSNVSASLINNDLSWINKTYFESSNGYLSNLNNKNAVNLSSLLFVNGSGGRVGIGTASPSQALHVDGEVLVEKSGAGSPAFNIQEDGTNYLNIGYNEVSHYGGLNSYTGGTEGNLILQSGGGKVVIGTNTTISKGKLNVVTSSSGASTVSPIGDDIIMEKNGDGGLSIITPDANTGWVLFGSPTDNVGAAFNWNFNSKLMQIGTAQTGGDVAFMAGTFSEKARLEANGNFGIGTSNPQAKLNVWDTSSDTSIMLRNPADTHNRWAQFKYDSDGEALDIIANGYGTGSDNWGRIRFQTGTAPTVNMVIDGLGKVGIGTESPSSGLLEVNGSVSGVSIYALNNISAEDYLYHSPFPSDSYTNEQALNDLINIKGKDGEIDHSTLPSNAVSIINKPIYNETIKQTQKTREVPLIENYTTKNCSYIEIEDGKYQYICDPYLITEEKIKQNCTNETKYTYEIATGVNKITNETIELDYYNRLSYTQEVCIDVTINETYYENETISEKIGEEEEPQTSIGMLIGDIIKSIQQLFTWNTEQDERVAFLESELCKKDNSYGFCT